MKKAKKIAITLSVVLAVAIPITISLVAPGGGIMPPAGVSLLFL